VSQAFLIDFILPAALCPGVDPESNGNDYHEYFWVRVCVCVCVCVCVGRGGELKAAGANCLEIW
jgi:hypothetical protein